MERFILEASVKKNVVMEVEAQSLKDAEQGHINIVHVIDKGDELTILDFKITQKEMHG